MDPFTIALVVWLLLPLVLLLACVLSHRKLKKTKSDIYQLGLELSGLKKHATDLNEKLAPIASVEDEVSRLRKQANDLHREIENTRKSYSEKKQILGRLEQEVAVYDERLSFAELGLYEPHFDFGDSEAYKKKITEVRDRQKAMITAKAATHCPADWTVEGSRAKGQTMINRQTRLTMRAFNNECDAAISNTRWNNAVAMEKRILNAAKAIDSANTSLNLTINEEFVALKLDELHLTHEYREQLKIEKEERAELARAEREEKKLLAEAEAAEKEEQKYQTLLDKARKEAGGGDISAEMQIRIADLESALADAHAASERARSMAEMTKCGYVYVISNIGSFGEDVVKIGLTRRLDPDDRVRELGDASVPFAFDTHAMIYSDEAPALETALHKEFADRRINMTNFRKEFFRVSLNEVEAAVSRLAPEAGFFKDREAQEWQETLARRNASLRALQLVPSDALPTSI
ncbi:DUF4041 domain-containing protein [Limimaricola soesokkakensis]|uniref:DUF4041 domain-containing protein n=1 Tax=Limimaricola soesokkakensis TaxID=1343159 RepID=UPI003517120C